MTRHQFLIRALLRQPNPNPSTYTLADPTKLRQLLLWRLSSSSSSSTLHSNESSSSRMMSYRSYFSTSVSLQQEVLQQAAGAAAATTTNTAEKTVNIIFVEADGTEKEVPAVIGKHLLDVAHDNNVELEGACGGELACSTCHLIFEQRIYDTLPPKLDDEEDMLDLAFAVTETSRLGCQIRVTDDFAGMKVQIPDDGF